MTFPRTTVAHSVSPPIASETEVLSLSWHPGPVPTGEVGHRLKCAAEGHDSCF